VVVDLDVVVDADVVAVVCLHEHAVVQAHDYVSDYVYDYVQVHVHVHVGRRRGESLL
jgi:hypothetical protein